MKKEDEAKAHVLIDFARMDAEDRMALLNCIPEETPGKKSCKNMQTKQILGYLGSTGLMCLLMMLSVFLKDGLIY